MAVTPPMNPEIKALWVQWLRDNVDKQGREALRTPEGTFCCLGGLCELAVAAGVASYNPNGGSYGPAGSPPDLDGWDYSTLPRVISDWAGLTGTTWHNPTVKVLKPEIDDTEYEECLATLNDAWDGYDFNQIADVIEAQL